MLKHVLMWPLDLYVLNNDQVEMSCILSRNIHCIVTTKLFLILELKCIDLAPKYDIIQN